MREKELLLYRNFEDGQLLTDMAWLMTEYANEFYNMEDKKALAYDCVSALLELAASHGFYGNIWHCYLANLMVNNENAYSTACEIVGPVEGTINVAALHDFEIFREFYQYDFNKLIQTLDLDCFGVLWDYQAGERTGKVYNTRIRDRICTIASKLATADTALEMKDIMTQFYKEYGVGRFGLHKAWRRPEWRK